jgi:hypothetical protein
MYFGAAPGTYSADSNTTLMNEILQYQLFGQNFFIAGHGFGLTNTVGRLGSNGNITRNGGGWSIYASVYGGGTLTAQDNSHFYNYVRVDGNLSFGNQVYFHDTVAYNSHTGGSFIPDDPSITYPGGPGAWPAYIHPRKDYYIPSVDWSNCSSTDPAYPSTWSYTGGHNATLVFDARALPDTIVDYCINHITMNGNTTKVLVWKNDWQLARVFLQGTLKGDHAMHIGLTSDGSTLKASTAYDGSLLWYVNGSWNVTGNNGMFQGTFITPNSFSYSHNGKLSGQLLAKDITLQDGFNDNQFRYIPFNPPEIDFDPTTWASGGFSEGGTPVDTVWVELDRPAKVAVSFDYYFFYGTATAPDFTSLVPTSGVRTITIPIGATMPPLSQMPTVEIFDDDLNEGDETFFFRIVNLQGAVFATDRDSLNKSYEFTITDNDTGNAPTDISIADNLVPENQPIATEVGVFSTTDLDVGDVFVYTLVAGVGATNNASFTISGQSLLTNAVFDYETKSSYSIRVRSTDASGAYFEKVFTINITNLNDAPIISGIPDQTVAEGTAFALIELDNWVSDPDNASSTLTWSISGDNNISASINPATRQVTLTPPNANWNGSDTLFFRVEDPSGAFDLDTAIFRVTPVNDAPVVSDIPGQTINEGQIFATFDLDDYVTDVDNTLAQLTWTYSGNSQLIVSIDATTHQVQITTPNSDWNGSETIIFRATDPSGAFSSDGAVFTVNSINDAPVVSNIPNQTIAEGSTFATISLDNYVSDVDHADALITWSYAGNSQLSVSINPTTRVATITIPHVNWHGSETITFTATDPGLLSASDPATFTVTSVNDAPEVSGIPDQTIPEGSTFATFDLDNYVTDADHANSTLVWTYTGNSALTVSINASNVVTITTPNVNWFGAETITFRATDPLGAFSSDAAVFTVTPINDPPVVNIPNQSILEGQTFATFDLDNYVTDPDNLPSQISWTYSGNTDLTVSINATTHVVTITAPNAFWNGTEVITFTANDGSATGSDAASFSVGSVNDAPVITDIPNQTIAEGGSFTVINFDAYVSDVDNTDAQMRWTVTTATNLNIVIDSTARTATITVKDPNWNGSETVTFTVWDPSLDSDTDAVTFTVTPVNDAPVVSGIPDQTINEGQNFATFDLDDYVSDVDNTLASLVWTYTGNTNLTVSINASTHVVTITTPNADWNGSETITFRATDPSGAFSSDAAIFRVLAVNDAPVVSDIPNQTILEGSTFATIDLNNYVTDIDNAINTMVWTYSGNSQLAVSINATTKIATITIPHINWFGTETITFTATDPLGASGSDPAVFTVTSVNDAPVVSGIPDQTINEGQTFVGINLNNYVGDVDHSVAAMIWSYSGNSALTVSIDGTNYATITIPNIDWNGSETITFTASDGSLSGSDAAVFRVNSVNDLPVVSNIPNQTVSEGSLFTTFDLDDFVADVDHTDAEITWTYTGNAALTVSIAANKVVTIGIPNVDWNGSETITFRATDPLGGFASDPATFTVTAVNDAPVISSIANQTINEGESFANVNLDGAVSDVDNTDAQMVWTASATTNLTVNISAGRVLSVAVIDLNWNGSESVTYIVRDPAGLADTIVVSYTVLPVNDAPVVDEIPDQTINEGSAFSVFNLNNFVADVDNSDAQIQWSFTGNTDLFVFIDGSRNVTITPPNGNWNGSETIRFTARDPSNATDFDDVVFTVLPINDAPQIINIPGQNILEGESFALFDLDTMVLDVDNLDSELFWVITGNSSLTVSIDSTSGHVVTITTPNAFWNGTEILTFRVSDPDGLWTEDQAAFTVGPVNDPPVVTDIPDQTVPEGTPFATILLDTYVSDVDNTDAEMTWTYSGNTDLIVSINNLTREATISAPNGDWTGFEIITFRATDPLLGFHTNSARFTVTPVNDAPVVSGIPDQTVNEGTAFGTFSLDQYVHDVDNSDGQMTWVVTGNSALNVSISVGRVVTITPLNPEWSGSETITFRATDPGSLFDTDVAVFTVLPVNDAPVMTAIPNQSVLEGNAFTVFDLDNHVSDVDNLNSQLTWTVSGNLNLAVTISATNVVSIVPLNVNWNGVENITFTVRDPSGATASRTAAFEVVAVNDPPVISVIPNQTINEGQTFTSFDLDNYVTDVDDALNNLSWSTFGASNLTITIGAGNVVSIVINDVNWNGSETISFIVEDPALSAAFRNVVFTVLPVNDIPVVTQIPGQTINEGSSFTQFDLDNFVTDVEDSKDQITWTVSGNSALIVNINPISHVVTIDIPDINWNGFESLTFTATDTEGGSASSSALFRVNPVNDPPIAGDIFVSVPETDPAGTIIAQLTAIEYDGDILTFSLGSHPQFGLNVQNQVYLKTMLDYETITGYILPFTVTDGVFTVGANLIVTVENIPEIPILAPAPYNIFENSPAGTIVDTVTVSNGTITGPVTFSQVSGGTGESVFEVATDGIIRLRSGQSLNYEGINAYTIRVLGRNVTGRSDTTTLTISVDNRNESPVVSTQVLSVAENRPVGFVIGNVTSSDPENNQSYVLVDNNNGRFTMDASGEVRLNGALDFETQDTIRLVFAATDVKINPSDTAFTVQAELIIVVTDANDAPIIVTRTLSVPENSPAMTVVGTVVATDQDDDVLMYTMSGASEFLMDGATGQIIVRPGAILNFEDRSSYTVTVTVSDGIVSVQEQITINITDANDTPVLGLASLSVSEGAQSGATVGTVQASDEDGDPLRFEIIGNPAFAISNLGVITLVDDQYLDYERDPDIAIQVRVYDPDGASDTATYVIEVINVLEFPNVQIILVADEDSSWTAPDTIWTNASSVDVDWTADGVLFQDVEDLDEGRNVVTRSHTDPTKDGPGSDRVYIFVNTQEPEIFFDLPIQLPEPPRTMIAEVPEPNAPGEIPLFYVNDPDVVITGHVDFINTRLQSDSSPFEWMPGLEEGMNEVTYTYTDVYGNTVSETIRLFLDTKAPVVEILDPEDGREVFRTVINVAWTVDGQPMDILLNEIVSDGENMIVRSYRDLAGNVGSDTVYVTFKATRKDVKIELEESLVNLSGDKVKEFLAVNPPEPNEVFALSVYNVRDLEEQELQWGKGSSTHISDGKPPYPGLNGGHLGPTLRVEIRVPHIGGTFNSQGEEARGGTLGELLAAQTPAERERTLESCIERYDLLPAADLDKEQLWIITLVMDVSIYDNIGQFVDRMRIVQDINNPDYINDDGFVTLFLEIKPDAESGLLKNQGGRHLGTGAYIIRGFVKSEAILKCDLPDKHAGFNDTMTESIMKIFGYARPGQ